VATVRGVNDYAFCSEGVGEDWSRIILRSQLKHPHRGKDRLNHPSWSLSLHTLSYVNIRRDQIRVMDFLYMKMLKIRMVVFT